MHPNCIVILVSIGIVIEYLGVARDKAAERQLCRAQTAFEASIKKGSRGCDYLVPLECLVQLNVLYDLRRRLDQLCLITSDPLASSERTLIYTATITVLLSISACKLFLFNASVLTMCSLVIH